MTRRDRRIASDRHLERGDVPSLGLGSTLALIGGGAGAIAVLPFLAIWFWEVPFEQQIDAIFWGVGALVTVCALGLFLLLSSAFSSR
jgi:hypothetical protein